MFEIEKTVPLPPPRISSGVATEIRALLPDMKVGDSFFVPATTMKPQTVRVTVTKEKAKLKPKNFTARVVQGGARVWRTE